MNGVPPFRPIDVLMVLERHDVRHVVIGGLAATLHGSPLTTGDADICPARDHGNLVRLAEALEELDARVYAPDEPRGLPFRWTAEGLGQAETWNLVTDFGRLDISFRPSGTAGYDDLRRDAVPFAVDDLEVEVASLVDVIRSKEAAGRERDRAALPTLRRLLEESED